MQIRHALSALAVIFLVPVAAGAQQPTGDSTSAHHKHAAVMRPKISQDSARVIVRAKVPNGQVKSAELEHEHGTLVYSYDITVPNQGGIEEVQVSALDGHVVSTNHETAAAERAEQQKEARERSMKHPAGAKAMNDSTQKR